MEARFKNCVSGCGSFGRAVASDTRGPWFSYMLLCRTCVFYDLHKYENKEKESGKIHMYLTLITKTITLPHPN